LNANRGFSHRADESSSVIGQAPAIRDPALPPVSCQKSIPATYGELSKGRCLMNERGGAV
jgi:hypothetical protein